jgi:PAS domain S-box-containing protein
VLSAKKLRDQTPDATFVAGPLGIIEDVDEGGCRLLGYPREAIVGMHGAELIPHDARPRTAVTLDRMRRGELGVRRARMLCSDGGEVVVEVSGRQLAGGRLELTLRKLGPR